MEIDDQIRDWLTRYVNREITLDALDAWLTPATWDLNPSVDPVADALASRVQLRIAEFSNGDLTEDELRADLAALVRWRPPTPTISYAGATSVVVAAGHLGAGSFVAGRSLAGASG